ncbi:MAG: hypothetical protein OSB12_07275 [Planctomycetota bacterium]|nr:hypothetical protein [Planctomycetota bacterium]
MVISRMPWLGLVVLLLSPAFDWGCSGSSNSARDAQRPVVAIYDSRAVAIAFVGSEIFAESMKEVRNEYDQATAAGDAATLDRIQLMMQQRQKILHSQGFGTAPVDEILDHYSGLLALLLKDSGAFILISKWNEDELAQHSGVPHKDVTVALIDLITTDPKQRQSALEILDHDPVTNETIENHQD